MERQRLHSIDCASRIAFTLVEVLVVVAITTFLAGMVLTYSSTGRGQVALYVESAKLAQVALRAKSLAISTYNNPDTPCAYGMRVDSANRSYSLFSYRPSSCSTIPTSGIDATPTDQGGPYREIETFVLQNEINFKDVPSGNALEYVLFVPPDPTTFVWILGGSGAPPIADTTGEVVLGAAQSPNTLKISVSPAGQISF
ncbi:MAG: hypothetical protein LiPW15_452 [Parcubacteria group bacterium LiPW_15]|nr:MAG: hypothetical protein LiPW15_452 [Parcubacteria group bacterium LiPW_15]